MPDDIEDEVESRLRATLEEEGEDPNSDSDHAMYLRQDLTNEIRAERRQQEVSEVENLRTALLDLLKMATNNADRALVAAREAAKHRDELMAALSVRRASQKDVDLQVQYTDKLWARQHEASRLFCNVAHRVGEALLPDYYKDPVKKHPCNYSMNAVADKLIGRHPA